jgi:hypothetical protein
MLPAGFMMVTTTASLTSLLYTKYIPQRNLTRAAADILLLALSVALVALAVRIFRKAGSDDTRQAGSEVA